MTGGEGLRAAEVCWRSECRSGCYYTETCTNPANRHPEPAAEATVTLTEAECGEQYAEHPTRPHLVAVCTLPQGHDGDHDNVLPKPLARRVAAPPSEADIAAVLADLTDGEAEAVDRFMDDHMYHHRHVGQVYAMGCDVRCRTQALAEAVRQSVLVPRRAAIAVAGKGANHG